MSVLLREPINEDKSFSFSKILWYLKVSNAKFFDISQLV